MPHRQEESVLSSAANVARTPVRTTGSHLSQMASRSGSSEAGAPVTPSSTSTPLKNPRPWKTATSTNITGIHRMMMGPPAPSATVKSTSSVDADRESTGGMTTTTSVPSLATESMDRETASVLLLVSAGNGGKAETKPLASQDGAPSTRPTSDSPSTVPLKKRKLVTAATEATASPGAAAAGGEPYHISPVSHASTAGRTISSEEGTPSRPGRVAAHAHRATSYDSKEDSPLSTLHSSTQELPASAKIGDAKEIALRNASPSVGPRSASAPATLPSSVVSVPHFPTVLHHALADPEMHSVLEWCPDGESWKVLRWDALRRLALPRYFSNLRDEHGKDAGTIDAFLYHLTAWGFEEMSSGPNVGAYRHELFIRGAQKLSSKMRLRQATVAGPAAVSPARGPHEHHHLQVPTLVDSAANKRRRLDEHAPPPAWPIRPLEYSTVPTSAHYYPPHESSHAYPRYPGYATSDAGFVPLATSTIRSTRGGMRGRTNTPSPAPRPTAFPVSNRGGKGNARRNLRKLPLQTQTSSGEATLPR